MKLIFKKRLSFLLILPFLFCSLFTNFCLTSCVGSNKIQLANFESYMDPILKKDLEKRYPLAFTYFDVNEMVEAKFEKYYDLAITSCYEIVSLIKKGWLEKLDWKQFNLCSPSKKELITNGNEAKELFEPRTIENLNNWIKTLNIPHFSNILDYAVPYFAQSLLFAYKGQEVPFYCAGTETKIVNDNDLSWKDVIYTISPQNKKLDNHFFPNQKYQKMIMLNDAKTMYDLARIIQTDNKTNQIDDSNNLKNIKETFSCLTKNFENRKESFLLYSDSGVISRCLANTQGNIGALTWSGDILHALKGADEYEPYSANNFHVLKPTKASLNEVDFLVINKNSSDQKKQQMYQIIKQICLDGYDQGKQIIKEINNNQERKYTYWPMQNFHHLNYTPLLKNLYEGVIQKESKYWNQYCSKDLALREKYVKILEINGNNLLYGKTLTPLQNSNLHWAWLECSEKLW